MIHVSDSELLTIAGGKWTTYRAMAEGTVDETIKVSGLENKMANSCVTDRVRLIGSDGWSRNVYWADSTGTFAGGMICRIVSNCDVPSMVFQQMS